MNLVPPTATNYDRFPSVAVPSAHRSSCWSGWPAILAQLREAIEQLQPHSATVVVDCYPGVHDAALRSLLSGAFDDAEIVDSTAILKLPGEIDALIAADLGGDDPVFGRLTRLRLDDFVDPARLAKQQEACSRPHRGPRFVVGPAAARVCPHPDLFIFADMPRWEGQLRQRRNEVPNLGAANHTQAASLKYKRSFFIDWRVYDREKQRTLHTWTYLLDTTDPTQPKMCTGRAHLAALEAASRQPFRVVPFFDPGPWGGQWMKQRFQLDPTQRNFAWCFDCVPEENSLRLQFEHACLEIPALNLVFTHPVDLLGAPVFSRFGAEFPIRFDFLDTIRGGNLSLQVHPLEDYAREHFGLTYTQDESYYILDAEPGATVFLGRKPDTRLEDMMQSLEAAHRDQTPFPAGQFAAAFPARPHDHFLIPAGTLHCSGAGCMVLEISATPYLFTFKLWDWGRLGLDGKPRPINLQRGRENLKWERDEAFARDQLVNHVSLIGEGPGWREERTGLHASEFIETRRHWFTGPVAHHTQGVVHVLNLVAGAEALVESPTGSFAPFVVHYAETFIVPASVGGYTLRPYGAGLGMTCATMKAYVRV